MSGDNRTYTSTTYQQHINNHNQSKKATIYGVTVENYTPQEIVELKQLFDNLFKDNINQQITIKYEPHRTYVSPTVDLTPWYRYGDTVSGTISGFIPDGYIVT